MRAPFIPVIKLYLERLVQGGAETAVIKFYLERLVQDNAETPVIKFYLRGSTPGGIG